jgi:intracellular septation protein A
MFSLAFILIVTCISIFISYSVSEDVTWFDYYKGGVIGLFISAVILQVWNKRKRNQEMKNKKSIYEK